MQATRTLRLALFTILALCGTSWAGHGHSKYAGRNIAIVVFQDGTSAAERRQAADTAGAKVVRDLPFIGAMVVELPGPQPTGYRQPLSSHRRFESMEDNSYRIWINDAGFDTGDPGLAGQTEALLQGAAATKKKVSSDSTALKDGEIPWGIARVHAPAVWSKTMGKGVKVGVIDTGIDSKHPDLAANYKGGVNIVDSAASPDDDNGHGSHVAGTIAAVKDGSGVVGVAPEASLYAIKVLDADGGGTPDAIVDGLQWAAEHGMDVVNLSLGGPGTPALKRAVKAANKAGVTVVAASGNDPKSPVSSPANYPEAIAVSASTKEEKLASFSTTGPEVAFIAPGHEVISDAPGGKLAQHSGTSMATPHVAGLAALAISLGAKGPAQVRAALQRAATPLDGMSAEQQGAGMIDASRLLKR